MLFVSGECGRRVGRQGGQEEEKNKVSSVQFPDASAKHSPFIFVDVDHLPFSGSMGSLLSRKTSLPDASTKHPPFIFLDVDGVLNNMKCMTYQFDDDDDDYITIQKLDDDTDEFLIPLYRPFLLNLKYILDTLEEKGSKCKIVMSSTWRLDPPLMSFLMLALDSVGIEKEIIVGMTPSDHTVGRGGEVQAYLNQHSNVKNYVILDDNHAESFLEYGMTNRFIQTYCSMMSGAGLVDEYVEEGLNKEKAEAVIALLS